MKVKKTKTEVTSALSKAVSNVKRIVKEKNKAVVKKVVEKKLKKDIKPKKKRLFKFTTGIVYLGHIPYGFHENEMKEYFKQFGKVTRVRLVRSKKSGKGRGYGYIEFENSEVAKVAAETMNNYLMCGRLLKTTYIPPDKQHHGFFSGKPWTDKLYPGVSNRKKELKKFNKPIDEKQYKKNVRRSLRQLSSLEEKLKKSGIDIKFKPVDIPKL